MLALPDDEMTITASTNVENEALYKKIQSYANEHEIKPINAIVDRIWKAIPGYNGLAVNIEASYKKMRAAHGFDVSDLVYKEISPHVHLNDLSPSPIYKGNPEKPMVALLINVAWGNEYIPQILKTLNKHQIKATFFFDGSWAKKNPDLAMMISKENHEIGNHAYSHPDLSHKSRYETMNELKKTNDVIKETLGIKPKWFAPPSGSIKQETVYVAHQLDIAEGLEKMIIDIKNKGFRLGTVSELMSEDRITKYQLKNDKHSRNYD